MSNLPRDDQLIVQGPRPWGPPTEAVLGRVERTCLNCGKDWDGDLPPGTPVSLGRRVGVCSHCGSAAFSERVVRPSSMVITRDGFTKVVEPPKPRVAATATDLFALRSLRTSLLDSINRLTEANAMLHQLVNVNETNYKVFGFLQAAVDQFAVRQDYELRIIDPLTSISLVPVLHALVAEIERTLNAYEQEKSK